MENMAESAHRSLKSEQEKDAQQAENGDRIQNNPDSLPGVFISKINEVLSHGTYQRDLLFKFFLKNTVSSILILSSVVHPIQDYSRDHHWIMRLVNKRAREDFQILI